MRYLITIFLFFNTYAEAYVGPGMGAGFIAGVFGLIIAIFATLVGILWFPFKRFLNKKKKQSKKKKPD